MSWLSDDQKFINEIRHFLRNQMTTEFTDSVKEAAKSIRDLIGDKETKERIQKIIEEMDEAKLVTNVSSIAKRINDLLANVTAEDVTRAANSINALMKQAEEAKLIENLSQFLKTVNQTCSSLSELGSRLTNPQSALAYGVWGVAIGLITLNVVNANTKNDNQDLKELIDIQQRRFVLDYDSLRVQYATFVASIETYLGDNPEYRLSPEVEPHYQHAKSALKILRPLDHNQLDLINKLKTLAMQQIHANHERTMHHESVWDFLSRVSPKQSTAEINNIIEYLVNRRRATYCLVEKEKPHITLYSHSYNSVQAQYTAKLIDTIMLKTVGALKEHGGGALYEQLIQFPYDAMY